MRSRSGILWPLADGLPEGQAIGEGLPRPAALRGAESGPLRRFGNGRHEDQRSQDPEHFPEVQHHERGRSETSRTTSRHPPERNRRNPPNQNHGHKSGHNFRFKGERVGGRKPMACAKCLKLNGGSAWESNPPGRVLAPHTGFEVREAHQ